MTLFSQALPDGSTLVLPYVYERTAGTSGFLGTRDSESAKVSGIALEIQPYEGGGLSLKRSDPDARSQIARSPIESHWYQNQTKTFATGIQSGRKSSRHSIPRVRLARIIGIVCTIRTTVA
jgi:hypothetical protein